MIWRMRYEDACRVLGLHVGASGAEVKRAYRAAVRESHPDLHPGDAEAAERFQQVHEAYGVLLQAEEGVAAVLGTEPAQATHREADFAEQRLPRQVPRRGPDVRGELRVSLQEIFTGTTTDITFSDREGCERCGATGGEPDSSLVRCPWCGGLDAGCRWCAGEGQLFDEPCGACHGAGVIDVERTVRVPVPRSALHGEELVLARRGRWGVEARGDVHLHLHVEEPVGMRRLGDDVEVDVTVSVLQAVLGGQATTPSLDGVRYRIPIPAGSSSGTRCRLRGKGLFRTETGDQRGDLYAVIAIRVPEQLSEQERWHYEKLLEEEAKRLRAGTN